MQFFGKYGIVCWRPPGELALPPRGNPGSATDTVLNVARWIFRTSLSGFLWLFGEENRTTKTRSGKTLPVSKGSALCCSMGERKCPMAEADPAASFFDSSTGTSRAVSCTSSCAIRQCSASGSHWNGTTAKSICWRNTSVGSEGLVQGYHQSYDHGRNGVFYCFLTNLQPTSL